MIWNVCGPWGHARGRAILNIELVAVGTNPPKWVEQGFEEYRKRLTGQCSLQLREIKPAKRGKGQPSLKWKEEEGGRMMGAIKRDARVVALDRGGRAWSTEELAENIDRWMAEYPQVSLLVGGPDGLAHECLSRSHEHWSLSRLTFPHFLVRVLVAEQIWRACSILVNHPYHK